MKSATVKKAAVSEAAVPRATASATTGARAGAAKSSGASKAAAKRPASPRYTAQQQPTPDRYREIQQALADRGYFRGTADGTWGPDSVDSLRRFQADQNLDADGKIGSLSLIALGLGPRRDNAALRSAPLAEPSREALPPLPATDEATPPAAP